MRKTAVIFKANCYFRITEFNDEFNRKVIAPFCRRNLYRHGQVVDPVTYKKNWVVTHVFARSNKEKTEYRLPHSMLDDFLKFAEMMGYTRSRIIIKVEKETLGDKVDIALNSKFSTPREIQKEWINYQLAPGGLKANNASTGQGKTFMALYTMVQMGVRTLITIQPRYITTWLNDIGKTLVVRPEDVVVWEMTDLELLVKNIETGVINPKIIILPLTRISGYLKSMKLEEDVPCLSELLDRTGCGLRIIDEGHESFHEVCMSMFYGNPHKTLLLSATLQSDDMMINKMYQTMIPIKTRLKEPDAENYIDIEAWAYRICPRKYKIKTVQFGSYSDIAFEQSILKSVELTQFYYRLMKKLFEESYLNKREEGTKCLFFFTLVDMSLTMLDLFRKDFPHLDFETYLGSLDKKTPNKYLEHEIVITTPGSCGVGKDIPGLITVICSHTVFSSQRNKQMIGRLRRLDGKFGDRVTPLFVFPVCSDIAKQKECFTKRKVAFAAKQKGFKLLNSNMELV